MQRQTDTLERDFTPEPAEGSSGLSAPRTIIRTPAPALALRGPKHRIDPFAEEQFWRKNYQKEAYFNPAYNFEDYGPAYRSGFMAFSTGDHLTFDDAEAQLRHSWEDIKDRSVLTWDRALHASKAGWLRVERAARTASQLDENDPRAGGD